MSRVSPFIRALRELPPTPKRRVRAAVAYRDLTISELAFRVGIDTSLVSRDLNGREPLRSEHRARIAQILDVPVDVLWAA